MRTTRTRSHSNSAPRLVSPGAHGQQWLAQLPPCRVDGSHAQHRPVQAASQPWDSHPQHSRTPRQSSPESVRTRVESRAFDVSPRRRARALPPASGAPHDILVGHRPVHEASRRRLSEPEGGASEKCDQDWRDGEEGGDESHIPHDKMPRHRWSRSAESPSIPARTSRAGVTTRYSAERSIFRESSFF